MNLTDSSSGGWYVEDCLELALGAVSALLRKPPGVSYLRTYSLSSHTSPLPRSEIRMCGCQCGSASRRSRCPALYVSVCESQSQS